MTPSERYQQDLQREGFVHDPAQEMAVSHLQRLYDDLLAAEQETSGLLSFLGLGKKKKTVCRGLYFWGGVGRGKTYLVDTFFDCLPFEEKMRTHFHRFMKRVHEELKTLDGQKNPLVTVARRLASETRIICFDEFFVTDITDAMILAGLFNELFKNGVSLVATSNIVPDELYKDGLQRARFIPAIELIKKYTEVVNVDHGVDYRLRVLKQAELYHHPLGDDVSKKMEASFYALAPDKCQSRSNHELEIEGRPIPYVKVCEDLAWFTFTALCDGPRSQNDYIELAREFQTILLSDIPQMVQGMDDQARRFINLVDEFYDRGVKLIMSGEQPLPDLYTDGKLTFEFQRTLSRLQEMQSHEYLAREHRP
ncbi:cell division protein ZapE [Sansalvadorimonas sp. 2012CJ34-2]|uniref:Cell division protein ZapE n=1 Tax=Parendozoicomonas callyspongiae TaxID=2942213 RepID=A0ABT0PHG3_9GAMM|nr:cell division protein ZapE [Sansalvadorimonas sp. 2012CJ34-2]MCL6270691.1 cell division protein ZapE [Sansalvadorimonas sp. 2012CJ34-2]